MGWISGIKRTNVWFTNKFLCSCVSFSLINSHWFRFASHGISIWFLMKKIFSIQSVFSFLSFCVAFWWFLAFYRRPDDLFHIRCYLLLKSESSCWWLWLYFIFGWSPFNGRWPRTTSIIITMVWAIKQLYIPNSCPQLSICFGCNWKNTENIKIIDEWKSFLIRII